MIHVFSIQYSGFPLPFTHQQQGTADLIQRLSLDKQREDGQTRRRHISHRAEGGQRNALRATNVCEGGGRQAARAGKML